MSAATVVPTAELRRSELDRLASRNDGVITPEAVVAMARNPQSALHDLFEWEDTEAARKYRILQAASYIRAVARVLHVPGSDEPTRYRAFLSLPSERGTGSYRATTQVMEEAAMRGELLESALRELRAFEEKYRQLVELAGVFGAVASLLPPVAR